MSDVLIRDALVTDLAALHPVIESAYRGDSARGGWTHEADLVSGPRISIEDLRAAVTSADELLLLAERGGRPIGCVQISRRTGDRAYIGLVTVSPDAQAGGLGRLLLAAAEQAAAIRFDARIAEMTVIEVRDALIDYYERRGYARSGERRPFPIALDPPLEMVVLEKSLA